MGLLSFMRELAGGGGGTSDDKLMKQELEQVRALAEAAERGEQPTSTPLGPKIRRHYLFTGTVHGVGFRWTATNLASSVGATGWIRNERDGSVTAEIQGIREQVDAVIDGLDRYYNGRRFMGGFRIERAYDVATVPEEYDFKPVY